MLNKFLSFPVFLVVFAFAFILWLNYIAWFMPDKLAGYLEYSQIPEENFLWQIIHHPYYMWFPRSIFTIALLAYIYFLIDFFGNSL